MRLIVGDAIFLWGCILTIGIFLLTDGIEYYGGFPVGLLFLLIGRCAGTTFIGGSLLRCTATLRHRLIVRRIVGILIVGCGLLWFCFENNDDYHRVGHSLFNICSGVLRDITGGVSIVSFTFGLLVLVRQNDLDGSVQNLMSDR